MELEKEVVWGHWWLERWMELGKGVEGHPDRNT